MYNKIIVAFFIGLTFIMVSCKKQLDVGNPNAPTLGQNVADLNGLIALSKGGVYFNGFRDGMGWLGDSYFNLPWTYHELMGDNLCGGEGSNNQTTTMGVPDYLILDNGSKLTNPSPQVAVIRSFNNRSATGEANNALYYEWLSMYNMNSAMNTVLDQAEKLSASGKINSEQLKTIQAWAHYWKGFAYAAIGTMYYGGLIIDKAFEKSSDFVSHVAIINASNAQFDLTVGLLPGAATADYTNVLTNLIPAHCQVGKGGVLSPAQWKATINTMKARNILLNHLSPFVNGNPASTITGSSITPMSSADWAAVKSLTDAGIGANDLVFTGRTVETNSFFSTNGGSVGAYVTGKNTTTGEKVSERLIQNFKSSDLRLTTNFNTATSFTNAYSFSTRWSLSDGGARWPNGAYAYGTRTIGAYELFISGSYEENALMNAEARIRTGDINGGVAIINAVRTYMGAGLPALGNGLTITQALTELTSERRVALAFRGLSFFDLRRWGWTYDISKGGGAYGQVFVYSGSGGGLTINSNVKVNYNYMDYWDVPGDETELNPAKTGAEFIKNPNF